VIFFKDDISLSGNGYLFTQYLIISIIIITEDLTFTRPDLSNITWVKKREF